MERMCYFQNEAESRINVEVEVLQEHTHKGGDSQDSRLKHCLFRGNTDIHIYITIMDTWQNMFLNGNMI